jgi:hypothetical protein
VWKEDLPKLVFCIGAEYDILANESRLFVCKLAGIEEAAGGESCVFEKGTYKWKLVKDVEHGFTRRQREKGEMSREELRYLIRSWGK